MELEPGIREIAFGEDPIMTEEEPVMELMQDMGLKIEGEYLLTEKPIMELEPGMREVPFTQYYQGTD